MIDWVFDRIAAWFPYSGPDIELVCNDVFETYKKYHAYPPFTVVVLLVRL